MLKQGVKTINAEFIWTRALSELSFVQFRPYAISFPVLFLSLALMSKIKKTLETSLDLTPSFQTGVDAKVERSCFECGLFINYDAVILFKRNMVEKDVCLTHSFSSIDCNFSFCTDLLHRWWLLKVKK